MTHHSPIRFGAGWQVALGGAAGAGVRWAVVAATDVAGSFPWATLLVNVAGCLVLGLVIAGSASRRLGIGTGFAGGLTTFSTLSVELAQLLRDAHLVTATSYLASSLVLGVAAFAAGARATDAANAAASA